MKALSCAVCSPGSVGKSCVAMAPTLPHHTQKGSAVICSDPLSSTAVNFLVPEMVLNQNPQQRLRLDTYTQTWTAVIGLKWTNGNLRCEHLGH